MLRYKHVICFILQICVTIFGIHREASMNLFRKAAAAVLTGCLLLTFVPAEALAASQGWKQKSGKWYYYDEYGKKVKGVQKIDGKIYFFDKKGVMQTGWQQDADGNWYYLKSSGAAYRKKWVTLKKKTYFFDKYGVMATGFQEIEDKQYYFKSTGALYTGFKKFEGTKYFFSSKGIIKNGWGVKDGISYYLDEEGAPLTGLNEVKGKTYIFDETGAMLKGWQKDEDGNTYYLGSDGAALKDTWKKISSKWYLFDENGIMENRGVTKVDSKYYYFKSSGAMAANAVIDGIRYGSSGAAESNPTIPLRFETLQFNGSNSRTLNKISDLVLSIKLSGCEDAELYYKVYKDGELVFTSDTFAADETVDLPFTADQGATFKGDFMAKGKYKFKVYTSDGTFFTSVTATVKSTAPKDEVKMKYSDDNEPLVCMMTQSTCYRSTRLFTPKGILWHSTGVNNPNLKRFVQPDDNAPDRAKLLKKLGTNTNKNDWNHIDRQVGLNFWIGKLANGKVAAVQTMPWNFRPWGCGYGTKGSGNDIYIQFEICEDALKSKSYFNACYKEACQMTAYLCRMFDIDPKGTIEYNGQILPTITDHTGAHSYNIGSNHGDIQHWSKKYGKTMASVRKDVAKILDLDTTSTCTFKGTWNSAESEIKALESPVKGSAYVGCGCISGDELVSGVDEIKDLHGGVFLVVGSAAGSAVSEEDKRD